ncbi:SDR family oxidoreductase [Rubrivivax gelatinosus]|uniref:SDR family oxidoreductase n=1 Tax=Rubrivivax gelatinosus TaxID=28068 RepID=UPI00030E4AF6|nr:SDR family oxidoreductase [Rubrivivax gelatinosus]
MNTDWQGRVAVITGAASGFGLETARIAAARGMKIVAADLQPAALDAAAEELRGRGAEVLPFRLDVAKAAEVEALAAATFERFGTPHFVFNNAGVGAGGLIWEQSAQDWQWVLGVNLMGVAHGVRVFVPAMLAAAQADPGYRGHVVNTASMAGLVNMPNMGVYNVSKHAVVALSETLYQDLSLVAEHVHAHVLCPFFVPTGIHESGRHRPAELAADGRPTRSQMVAQAMMEKAVTGGKVSAADVAQQVFDAMDENRFYIFSHPQTLGSVRQRMDDLVAGRNPSDAFADRPQVGEQLRAALRGRG